MRGEWTNLQQNKHAKVKKLSSVFFLLSCRFHRWLYSGTLLIQSPKGHEDLVVNHACQENFHTPPSSPQKGLEFSGGVEGSVRPQNLKGWGVLQKKSLPWGWYDIFWNNTLLLEWLGYQGSVKPSDWSELSDTSEQIYHNNCTSTQLFFIKHMKFRYDFKKIDTWFSVWNSSTGNNWWIELNRVTI